MLQARENSKDGRDNENVNAAIDLEHKNGNIIFYQAFIRINARSGIIIFNNTQHDGSSFTSGTHYQGVIPQDGKSKNYGKVPFINWTQLVTTSGGKKTRSKKSKTKKSKTKKSKTKKSKTKKSKSKKSKTKKSKTKKQSRKK